MARARWVGQGSVPTAPRCRISLAGIRESAELLRVSPRTRAHGPGPRRVRARGAAPGGYTPGYAYAEHAVVAANAALTEARGDLQAAADAYADAADRWERFGVVPEQGFALLGQGRCLLGLARPTEAAPVLQHAREIFERLQAAPALAETDALLAAAADLG